MDIRHLITVVRTRWLVLFATAMLGAMAGLAASLLSTPTYSSTTQLYVTSSGGESGGGAAYQGSLASQQRVQSYSRLVNSRDVVDKVRSASGVDLSSEDLQGKFSASTSTGTVLLDVTAYDPDPGHAQLLARSMGEVLTEYVSGLETPAGGGEPLAKLTVVGPATMSTVPDSPKTLRNIALGLLGGLVAGIGLAVLQHLLDRRIKSKEALEKAASAPMIGSVPMNKKRITEPAVPFKEGYSPEAEEYRSLRTNIQFLNVDNPPRVLVLTSSLPGEGKSTTTLNLGIVLAEAGHKVIVVEADLRRPRIAKYMGLSDSVGLTSILTGQATIEDVVQESNWHGLDLLACGPIPPNPSELLGSYSAEQALETLRKKYEYVLIDSPPVLPVTDASILSRLGDGMILVARYQKTTTDQLKRAVEILARVDGMVLGTVLTLTDLRSKRNGQYGSYYDRYYASDNERHGLAESPTSVA